MECADHLVDAQGRTGAGRRELRRGEPLALPPLAITAVIEALTQTLPAGLLSVIHGGPATGEAMGSHRLIRKVAFTGGDVVARAITATAARGIVPTVMALSGNDAAIFSEDAKLDSAAYGRIVVASYATSGQVCMASRRIFIPRSRHEEFVSGFQETAKRMILLGDPVSPGVIVGPVVTRQVQHRLMGPIAAASARGGQVLEVGHLEQSLDPNGCVVRPQPVLGQNDETHSSVMNSVGRLSQ